MEIKKVHIKAPKPRKIKKGFWSSWLTSLVSISMVLVLLGMLGIIVINAGKLADYVREKIGFTVVLSDEIKDVDVIRLQKVLNATKFVKSSRFIDKEAAAKELTEDLGEDFSKFLGYNPLFSSIELKLYAAYTSPDSLKIVEDNIMKYGGVKEVYYQKNLVSLINQNIRKISIILLIISGLLLFIFVALINNTIRISIYSQRFTINTMQMVGANNAFIRRPFIQRSILLGLYGGLIANAILFFGIFSYEKELEGIVSETDVNVVVIVFLLVITLGIFISWVSTYLAVNKFLKMKFDELFY